MTAIKYDTRDYNGMEVYIPPVVNFMRPFTRFEPVIMDSTAMMTFKACPRKYFYRIVLGFDTKNPPPYFPFGSAYHRFREHFEKQIRLGAKEQEAFVTALANAEAYADKHLKPQEPGSQWDFMTKARLRASCAEAFKHIMEERVRGKIEVVSFEQPFVLVLEDGTKVAGRADQIVKWNGKLWGRDFKTTSKLGPFYQRSLEPNDQFTRYTWAEGLLSQSEVVGQIVEVLYNSKREGPKIETFTTQRTKGQIERWKIEHRWWMDLIEKSRDTDMYPMNEKSCWNCEFHSVCKAPSESGMMSQLKSYFKPKPWNCLNVEQEGE